MDAVLRNLGDAAPALASATLATIACAFFASIIALLIGIPAGLGRLSRSTLLRGISTFYVETIRGTPLLLQLVVWYFGVAILLGTLFNLHIDAVVYAWLTDLNSNRLFPSTGVSNFFFGIIGLGFNYGAYIAEVVRAGILAVDYGETEAAYSLGMTPFQTMRHVVLPQALRLVVPPLTNNLITLVQDTSFLQVMAVVELSLQVQFLTTSVSSPAIRWAYYVVELAEYFVICYGLALVAQRMERRTAHRLAGAH